MNRVARRIVSLASVVLLLSMQAVPAFAVCRCDHPDGRSCCNGSRERETAPEPEPAGCCAREAAAPVAPDPHAPAYSDECCRRGVVPVDAVPAAVPTAPASTAKHAEPLLVLPGSVAPVAVTTAGFAAATPWRGPPPGRSAPLFLLHSSLLS